MRQNDERKKYFHIISGMRNMYFRSQKRCVTVLRIKSGFINSISESYDEMGTSKNITAFNQNRIYYF